MSDTSEWWGNRSKDIYVGRCMKHVFKKDSIGIPGGGLKYVLNVHPEDWGFMIQFDGCIFFELGRTKPPTRYNLQPIIFAHETNAIRDIAGYHWYSFWRISQQNLSWIHWLAEGPMTRHFPSTRFSHGARLAIASVVAREWWTHGAFRELIQASQKYEMLLNVFLANLLYCIPRSSKWC